MKLTVGTGNALVHTVDISYTGARLGGLREHLQPGTTVGLSRGTQRAKFRIIWVQQLGDREFQAGIEAMQAQPKFWGVDLEAKEREAQESVNMLMSLLKRAANR